MRQGREFLREVLVRIQNGELEHNQEHYHCGTAHCIAGWYIWLTLEERGFNIEHYGRNFDYDVLDENGEMIDEWGITQQECNLTDHEANGLFAFDLELDQIIAYWNVINRAHPEYQI